MTKDGQVQNSDMLLKSLFLCVRCVHPPQLDERRLVVPVIHLQAHAVSAFDDSSDRPFDEPPRVAASP